MRAPSRERGTGLLGTLAALLVFLVFLLFAVQLLLGWYATSLITAVVHQAASRAAADGAGRSPRDLETYTAAARQSLGRMGTPDRASFTWRLEDEDADGLADVVTLRIVARAPRAVPSMLGGELGLEEIAKSVRVRIERSR